VFENQTTRTSSTPVVFPCKLVLTERFNCMNAEQ
jgi:hypothetical protein